MARLPEVMQGFFALLKSHKEEGIMNFLTEDFTLDDPLHGRFSGTSSFRSYSEDLRAWLVRYNAGVEPTRIITSGNGIAVEYRFMVTVEGKRRDLPLAIAADLKNGLVAGIRIYHGTWIMYGKHLGISPSLAEDAGLQLPSTVEKYMKSLEEGSPESIVGLFEDEGYVREPSGDSYTHSGKENLLEFYSAALSSGGIPLKHCNLISGGNDVAVEYYFSEWGGRKIPRQAGIAFYELSESGKLKAVRIYDDADPPV